MQTKRIGNPGAQVRNSNTYTAEQHQGAAAVAVDEKQCEESEQEIDGTGDHDVEKNVVQAVARAPIDLLCIVKENVDAAPLLQHGQDDTDEQQPPCPRSEKLAPPDDVSFGGRQRIQDTSHLGSGIRSAAD